MPAQYREIQVAPGHRLTVRRSRQAATRAGFVMVEKSHRPPFEVREQCWQEGRVQ
jgi:hypothetical protein